MINENDQMTNNNNVDKKNDNNNQNGDSINNKYSKVSRTYSCPPIRHRNKRCRLQGNSASNIMSYGYKLNRKIN